MRGEWDETGGRFGARDVCAGKFVLMVIAVQLSDLAVKWHAVSHSREGGEPGEANGTAV